MVGGSLDLAPIQLPRLVSCSFVLSRRVVRATARDPPLRSTKGEGGVCGGQSVSRLPEGAGKCLPSKLSDNTQHRHKWELIHSFSSFTQHARNAHAQ